MGPELILLFSIIDSLIASNYLHHNFICTTILFAPQFLLVPQLSIFMTIVISELMTKLNYLFLNISDA